MARPRIKLLGVWIPRRNRKHGPRIVLHESQTHVIYTRGGDRHYECSRVQLLRWRAKNRAEKVKDPLVGVPDTVQEVVAAAEAAAL